MVGLNCLFHDEMLINWSFEWWRGLRKGIKRSNTAFHGPLLMVLLLLMLILMLVLVLVFISR